MSKPKSPRPLGTDELDQIAGLFKMLGEPMRLRILQAVCGKPRTVNEVVGLTGSTQANVSKHLALLATSGLLSRQKEGQRVFYGVKERLALKLCEVVHEHFKKSAKPAAIHNLPQK